MIIKKNVSLKSKTTFRIGGKAKFYCEPANVEDCMLIRKFASDNSLRVVVLGGGANTLFPDGTLDAVVVSMSRFRNIKFNGNEVVAGAGLSVDDVNRMAIKHSLSGMEFSGGLPGSIGGAVYMNARCYGKEFADILKSVKVFDRDNKVRVLIKDEIGYGYKTSVFMKEEGLFILECTFMLENSVKDKVRDLYLANVNDRKNKGQFLYPSAGCIFKNDYNVGVSSGKLIDEAGFKGCSVGGAVVYEKHANFIVNKENATSDDVKQLIKVVQDGVYKTKGVMLEPEVRIIE